MVATRSSPRRPRTRSAAQTDESSAVHVAEYIAAISAELAAMAGGARLDMLTYFLNMARLEAEFHMRQRK